MKFADGDLPQVTPPESLVRLQAEFGRSMATPFEFVDEDGEYRVQLDCFSPEIVALMVPREDLGLTGAERLATYNQQYWFRLFTVMQEEYPLLRHLLGVTALNRLVSDYLTRYPSRSPTLRDLSNDFPRYLRENRQWTRTPHVECAELEYAFIQIFDAAMLPPLDPARLTPEETAALVSEPLRFQPHVRLFEEHWNLLELRKLARRDVDDELTLEPIPQHRFWALYRTDTATVPRELDEDQFYLLSSLQEGTPLGEALDTLATDLPLERLERVAGSIQAWFAEWAALGWFAAAE